MLVLFTILMLVVVCFFCSGTILSNGKFFLSNSMIFVVCMSFAICVLVCSIIVVMSVFFGFFIVTSSN